MFPITTTFNSLAASDSQTPNGRVVAAAHCDQEQHLDGLLDEPLWSQAKPVDVVAFVDLREDSSMNLSRRFLPSVQPM